MTDGGWQADWDRLCAEREDARRRWLLAVGGLTEKARDPIGLKAAARKRPFVVAGVSAGVGALLAMMLFGGRRRPSSRQSAQTHHDEPSPGPSVWSAMLQNAVMSVATPLVTNFVQEQLVRFMERRNAPAPAPAPDRQPADGPVVAEP